MKKILVCALAAVALTFTSCDQNKPKTEPAATDSTEVVAAPNFTNALKDALDKKDAASIQTAIEAAQTEIDNLKASGKLDQAKEALKSLQAWLQENAETVKSVVGDNAVVAGLLDKVSAINVDSIAVPAAVEDAAAKVEEAKEAVEDVQNKVEEVKTAVEDVKAATEDVKAAAQDVKDKAEAAKNLLKK